MNGFYFRLHEKFSEISAIYSVAGLASARVRGRKGVRLKVLSKKAQDKVRLAKSLYNEKIIQFRKYANI